MVEKSRYLALSRIFKYYKKQKQNKTKPKHETKAENALQFSNLSVIDHFSTGRSCHSALKAVLSVQPGHICCSASSAVYRKIAILTAIFCLE